MKKYLAALFIVAFAVLAFGQVTGKYFGFTPDRYWDNNGVLKTDNVIWTCGTSNALKFSYSEGVYSTLALSSASALTQTTGTYTQSHAITTAALGTVRGGYFKTSTLIAGSATSGNLVGVRGEVNIPSGDTIGGGIYLYGAQGKLVFAGTMNHADSRLCGALAQLDISAGTYTTGQLSAMWIDAGTTASTSAVSTKGGGQFNLLRITNTTAASSNSVIYAYADADYLFELGGPGGNADWYSTTGTPGAVTGGTGWLKVFVGGAVRYIPLASSVS